MAQGRAIHIRNSVGYFGVLCREYLTSAAFYLAVLLFLLICFFGISADVDGAERSAYELFTDSKVYMKACKSVMNSSYLLLLQYDSMPWFSVVMPVVAAFPALAVFTRHYGDFRIFVLSRVSKKGYSLSLFLSSFLSGFFIALLGISVYAAVIYLRFPTVDSFGDENILSIYGAAPWERFVPFFKRAVNCCVMCGVFPLLTVLICAVARDRFLSLTLPMMIQYLSVKLNLLYSLWLFSDEAFYSSGFFRFVQLLFPSNCMSYGSLLENGLGLPFVCFFIMAGAITAVLYAAFSRIVRLSAGGKL